MVRTVYRVDGSILVEEADRCLSLAISLDDLFRVVHAFPKASRRGLESITLGIGGG